MRPQTLLLLNLCYAAALLAAASGHAGAGQLSKARSAARGSTPAPSESKPSGGKLDTARREARPAPEPHEHRHEPAPARHRRRPRGGHGFAPSSCGGWGFAGPAFWSTPCHTTYIVEQPSVYQPVAPSYVPAAPAPPAEPYTPELRRSFACFPYAGSAEGFLNVRPAGLEKPWLGAVRFELGSDFDGLSRQGLSAQVEGSMGWCLDFHWDAYRESLPEGGYDELHIGDLNAMYRVVETDHSLIRVGLGVNWLGDAVETNAGVNFTVKADFAPCRPFVFSTELDMGRVGEAEMLHGAATLGVTTDRLELFGGYDYRRIGEAELQGPMVGLRLWF